jgi:exodeoxyribonuclease VIII
MLTPEQLTGKQREAYEAQMRHAKKIFPVGVHDISNEDYHISAGLSKSGLNLVKDDPYYYWAFYLNPDRPEKKETKRSLDLGNAVHSYLLERDKFNNAYIVMPEFSGKGSREKKAAFIEEHKDKILINADDLGVVKATANAVQTHPKASLLLGEDSVIEKSLFWIDEETGLLCKSRPDIILGNLTIDLKTTDKPTERWFSKSIHNFGYNIQAAMMADAQKATLEAEPESILFIACEPKYPYYCKVYPLGEPSIEKGREDYKKELYKVQPCFIENNFSLYKDQLEEINIPGWAFY